MTTPFDIVRCEKCEAQNYAGHSHCFACGEPSEWKKKLSEKSPIQAEEDGRGKK